MSKHLNNDLRQEIVSAVIAATFDARKTALLDGAVAFADRAYAALIPALFASIQKSLPPDWFLRTTTIRLEHIVLCDGTSDRIIPLESLSSILDRILAIRSGDYDFRLSAPQAFPHKATRSASWCGTLVFDDGAASAALLAEYDAMKRDAETWLEERKAMSERLTGFLASVKTVQRLLEAAPELKPYIPDEALADRAPVPAPVIGSLIADLMHSGLKLSTVEVPA